MGEIERRAGAEPPAWWRVAPPAFLFAGTKAAIMADQLLLAAILGVLTVVTLIAATPRSLMQGGMDAWKMEDFSRPEDKWRVAGVVAVPLALTAGGFALQGADLAVPPELASAGYILALGGSWTFAFRRFYTEAHRSGRRRVRHALETADLDALRAPDLDALDSPDARRFVRGLLAVGAVDGIRVTLKRLGSVVGSGVDKLVETSKALEGRGLVARSTLMSPSDPEKWYVELTTKGVAVVAEHRKGR